MRKKMLYLTLLFLSVCFIFHWTGCESTINDSSTDSVELESTGSLQLSFSKASITTTDSANTVDTVTAILTRSHYESILVSLALGDETASGIMYNVAEGTWQLTVKAKDSTGTVLYSGVAQVEIAADTTTYVTLELSSTSTSGNLSITVTWEQGDGINWTVYEDNPVLDVGASGEWDDSLVSHPTVLYNGEKYEMWYGGNDGNITRIGYAYSSDGISWTKYSGNPVLGDEDYAVGAPSVIYDGTNYEMWYVGRKDNGSVHFGYATSIDGVSWTEFSDDTILELGTSGAWDYYSISSPEVIFNGTSYEMWYQGYDSTNYRIGYATSPDGVTWTKYSGNPVVDLGESGEWDSKYVIAPSVIFDGTSYKMWYSGYATGVSWQIGYASSIDGINWTKSSSNPIISTVASSAWNSTQVLGETVLYNGSSYKMWFQGSDGTNHRIGYATSP